jgi:phage N-6-adenine-methyltransferase
MSVEGWHNSVHASSATVEWATPGAFFAKCEERFGPFDLDVCATPENAKCARFFTIIDDGLAQEWTGMCWMNPPYGRGIGRWMRKAYESSLKGATVVCLVPSRTDTAWWHDYAMRGRVEFIRGRLKFGGCKDNAPFPCALVIFESLF